MSTRVRPFHSRGHFNKYLGSCKKSLKKSIIVSPHHHVSHHDQMGWKNSVGSKSMTMIWTINGSHDSNKQEGSAARRVGSLSPFIIIFLVNVTVRSCKSILTCYWFEVWPDFGYHITHYYLIISSFTTSSQQLRLPDRYQILRYQLHYTIIIYTIDTDCTLFMKSQGWMLFNDFIFHRINIQIWVVIGRLFASPFTYSPT
jgi:hypothetical protein